MALPLPDVSQDEYNAQQAQNYRTLTQPLIDAAKSPSLTPSSTFIPPIPRPPSPDPTLSPNQNLVRAGGTPSLRSRNLISNQFDYQADQELTPTEAAAACGPTAALAFARYAGRNPTIGEALSLAKQNGWSPSLGMAGPQSEVMLLGQLGVHSQYNPGTTPQAIASEIAQGRPVILDTPNHYYAIDDYDPQRGFHVGGSGLALRGGAEWMTWDQIAAHGNGVRGSITTTIPGSIAPNTVMDRMPYSRSQMPTTLETMPYRPTGKTFAEQVEPLMQTVGLAPTPRPGYNDMAGASSGPRTYPTQSLGETFAQGSRRLLSSVGINLDQPATAPQNAPQPATGPQTPLGYNDMVGAVSAPPQPYSSQYGQPAGIQTPQALPPQDIGATSGSGGEGGLRTQNLPGLGEVNPNTLNPMGTVGAALAALNIPGQAVNTLLNVLGDDKDAPVGESVAGRVARYWQQTDPNATIGERVRQMIEYGNQVNDPAFARMEQQDPDHAWLIRLAHGFQEQGTNPLLYVGTDAPFLAKSAVGMVGGAAIGAGISRLTGGTPEQIAAASETGSNLGMMVSPLVPTEAIGNAARQVGSYAAPVVEGAAGAVRDVTAPMSEAERNLANINMGLEGAGGGKQYQPEGLPLLGSKPNADEVAQAQAGLAARPRAGVLAHLQSAPALAQKRLDLEAQALEGIKSRYWYEDSGTDVLDMMNGDKKNAEEFAQLLAIYSPTTAVEQNTQRALQAWTQGLEHPRVDPEAAKAFIQRLDEEHPINEPVGTPERTKQVRTQLRAWEDFLGHPPIDVPAYGEHNLKATELLYGGIPWSGRKTNNFYVNLMTKIDPGSVPELDKSTIDLWIRRAFGVPYSQKGGINDAQYEFMADEIRGVTDRLNARLAPGEEPFTPHQVQAMIWTSERTRGNLKAGQNFEQALQDASQFHFGTYLHKSNAQVSWESAPGRTSGLYPEYYSASPEVQNAFHAISRKALEDAQGKDIISKEAGLTGGRTFNVPGVYRGEVTPGSQTEMSVPEERQTRAGTVIQGAEGTVFAPAARQLDVAAAAKGIALKQDSVGWTRVFPTTTQKNQNVAALLAGRPFTNLEAARLDAALNRVLGEEQHALISTEQGAWILNTGDRDNVAFQKAVDRAAHDVQLEGDTPLRKLAGQADSHKIENDWQRFPNGENYRIAFANSGRPEKYEKLADAVAQRVAEAQEQFAQEQGWTPRASTTSADATGGYRPGEPPFVPPAPSQGLATPPAVGGAVLGAAYGSQQGNTPEERARNALFYGVAGGVGGHLLTKASHTFFDHPGEEAAGLETVQARAARPRAGTPIGNQVVHQGAQRYVKEAGIAPGIPDTPYVTNNVPLQKGIANAYDTMQHAPQSGEVQRAYGAFKKEVDAQYDFATKPESQGGLGMTFEPWTQEGQPYHSSAEMRRDVVNNRHLYFFTGGELPPGHPLADIASGGVLTTNDKFRAIHDLFGHSAMGFDFGPRGEENAWREHAKMFSPEAQKALATETRGQNSWINYGPHGAQNQADKANTIYADQKALVLPAWARTPESGTPASTSQTLVPTVVGTILGGLAGYEKPANSDEERLQNTVFGAVGAGMGAKLLAGGRPAIGLGVEDVRGSNLADLEARLARIKAQRPDLSAADLASTPLGQRVAQLRSASPTTTVGPTVAAQAPRNLLQKYVPSEVQRVITQVARDNPKDFGEAVKGVLTNDDVDRLAAAAGASTRRITSLWKPGVTENGDAMLQVLNAALTAKGREVADAAKEATSAPTPNTLLALQVKMKEQQALQKAIGGVASDTGRKLAQAQQAAKAALASNDPVKVQAAVGGTTEQAKTEQIAQALQQTAPEDTTARQIIVRDANKPSLNDKLTELWYNAILSAPPTHLSNMISNTVSAVTQVPESLLSAAVEVPRAAITGQSRSRYFGEIPAELKGMATAIPEGISKALYVMKNGFTFDFAVRPDLQRTQALTGPIGNAINMPSRALAAADVMGQAILYSGAKHSLAFRQAASEGLSGKALADRVAELITNPSDTIITNAKTLAEYRLFRAKPDPFTKALITFRDDAKVLGFTPMRYVIPFLQTPVNLVKFGLERSPLGWLNPDLWRNVAKGSPEASDNIARAFMGSALAAGIASMFANGSITGAAPRSPADRDAFYREGKQPFSIKIGNTWVGYQRMEPFNQAISQVAGVVQALDEGKTGASVSERAAQVGETLGQNLSSQTYLRGISDLFNALMDPQRYGGRYLQQQAASAIPFSSVTRTAARMTDPTIRQPENILQTVEAQVPGLSRQVPPKLNAFGQEQQRPGSPLIPYTLSAATSDPVERELARYRVEPGLTGKEIRGLDLSPSEARDYQRISGQVVKQWLDALVASPAYANLTDNQKARALQFAITHAHDAGAKQYVGSLIQSQGQDTVANRIIQKKQAALVGSR